MEGEESSRAKLEDSLREAGYDVLVAASCQEGLAMARERAVDVLLLDAEFPGLACADLLAEMKGAAASADIRVISLVTGGAAERVRGLDTGADDVLSRPWDASELLARLRAQLRARKTYDRWREKANIAQQGMELSRTAFTALAVTEKMTRDAFRLGRGLKLGLAAVFVGVAVMAGIFFWFSRRATTETRRSYAVIERLNRGLASQEELIQRARKISDEMEARAGRSPQAEKTALERQSHELRARMASAPDNQIEDLRKQLASTEERLRQVELETSRAQNIIHTYASSVCLIHVLLGFREKSTGRPLRYAGFTPEGEPIQDKDGNVELTVEGTNQEAQLDILGTGFLVSKDGRILTNHHVVEPWWNNDELAPLAQRGLEPVVIEMVAYFPGSPRAFPLKTERISSQADLAVARGNLSSLKRTVIPLEGRRGASVSGVPVVLMGYATGLDAVLARADDSTVRSIVQASRGNSDSILAALAEKNLIHPIVTQGHIGDVLSDKIVYDAQTTSGGSGGPLFDPEGKVIGVNYAVLKGFGGSNFGIPIRYAREILAQPY